jgi:hypothetical protein
MKQLTECDCGCGGVTASCQGKETNNYMFFQNLKTIQHAVGELLEMDPTKIDKLLSAGHGWAIDHITTSADDVEEVYHFITSNFGHDTQDSYNSQQPQFVPAGFKNHLKQSMNEKIQKVDGGWAVYPSKGGKRLGTHPTKKAALKQLAAIEIAKHRK